MSRGIARSREIVCPALIFGGMMDTTSNTFARRARLSTAYIAVAVVVTVAAATAVLYSTGRPTSPDFKIVSPITSQTSER